MKIIFRKPKGFGCYSWGNNSYFIVNNKYQSDCWHEFDYLINTIGINIHFLNI